MKMDEQNTSTGLDYEELLKSGKLRKLQLRLLDILKTFDRICREENLTYFAFFGTLLGAVRHKGFIPWDSDIDVVMPREDFERFRTSTFHKLPENLKLQDYHTDNNFTNLFFRICDVTTFVQFQGSRTSPQYNGVFIDIFPLDNLKSRNGLKPYLQAVLIKKTLQSLSVRAGENQAENRTFKQKIANFIAHMFPRERWMRLRERLARNDKGQKDPYYVSLSAGSIPNSRNRIYEKKYFYPVAFLPFEDFSIPVPPGYHEILAQTYGMDYMEFPPEEERYDHIILTLNLDWKPDEQLQTGQNGILPESPSTGLHT